MKKIYSLVTLIMLLFTVSGCDDDYRSMALFEGVEPIYQVGTCDNLISSLNFYLTDAGEAVVGIDGGDGNYQLINEHESVASVTFTDDINGYQRFKVQPLAEGETVVKVMDGEGDYVQLHITVKNRRQLKLLKAGFEYGITESAPKELLPKIISALDGRPFLQNGGYYLLIPDKAGASYLEKGVLEIYPTGNEKEPLVGRYDSIPVEDETGDIKTVWQFTYGDEKRVFYRTVQSSGGEAKIVLVEDITSFCPSGLLPNGVIAIYRELFRGIDN